MSEIERRRRADLKRTAEEAPAETPGDGGFEGFTVDTGLFQELGALLVGRDSTALVELIKNAYDADATEVTVVAHDLKKPTEAVVVVTDNGNGMTAQEFRRGFLRVASRLKSTPDRRSPVYGRRFTGAKGIGRLAAHKLASQLAVVSRSAVGGEPHSSPRRRAKYGVRATIDWDEVEQHETLDDVGTAVSVRSTRLRPSSRPGTTITMRSLRKAWSERERMRFVREISSFQPGRAFTDGIAPTHVAEDLLFRTPDIRDSTKDEGFTVTLGGEFDVGEDYTTDALEIASWVVEVTSDGRTFKYAVAPTQAYAKEAGLPSTVFRAESPPLGEEDAATFQARVFVRSGTAPQALNDAYGVRVYMEGFRVLPYGEPGDDWLDVNRRYASRGRGIDFVGSLAGDSELPAVVDGGGLVAAPLKGIFGAVFLTESGAPSLQMLVNREGFVPTGAYFQIQDAMRNALALQTRVSAALRPDRRTRRRASTPDGRSNDRREDGPTPARVAVASVVSGLRALEKSAVLNTAAKHQLVSAITELDRVEREFIDEQAMLRVLASLGTQSAAFVHEINSAIGSVASLKRALDRITDTTATKSDIARLRRRVDALQRTLERQAAYLVEIVSPDARRRRSSRRLAEHFEHATLILGDAAERAGVKISNQIPEDLRTPPMFPAEVTSIFTNLLSNAIKAAGDNGLVEAHGTAIEEGVRVNISNTGNAVSLRDSERWFKPYESTTADVDPSLGQGMGLGLSITRALLREYRGTIEFVEPAPGFATTISMRLPK